MRFVRSVSIAVVVISALFSTVRVSYAQENEEEQGHSIGKVSVLGDLIVIELNEDALGKSNLFDLTGRTLRFIPEGLGYRIENRALRWDSDYGPELPGTEVRLRKFSFPFSGKHWDSFLAGITGTIRFGVSEKEVAPDAYGHRDSGIVLDRFDQLAEAAGKLSDKAPAICVFLKPRMSGSHYVKELSDRVVVTWDLTEPYGGILDFTWFPNVNRFQAVLHRDGSIEMSYKELAAKDAIVGIYPTVTSTTKPSAVHFSAVRRSEGPWDSPYEAFHYLALPKPQDLSCTVIQALGDNFDFLAYYSDFRVDNQEASTPSDGPIGGDVSGIGNTRHPQSQELLKSRCTQGRLQLEFQQPVYVSANEMQAGPPDDAPADNPRGIAHYRRQLGEASPNGKLTPYNYAVGHLGHEVGHRWGAYVAARVQGQTISLGAWPHWDRGLQARVVYPYSLPTEASTLGGGVWQDNRNGTYTQLRDGYFVPAAGYSYLDLYLMGLISAAEVPDFFILKNLVPEGKDANGHPIFKADQTKIAVQDVIAAEGPRSPSVDYSQRKFNTGIVVIVEHGKSPTPELLERANGIRRQWMTYWGIATGHRAIMTATPNDGR